jgi:DNA-binding transcriptional MerR regulator
VTPGRAVPTEASQPAVASVAADGPGAGYTIDQLETMSGVPARTIRFYRQSGLIEPPRRVGRNAYYAPEQLGRLRFIAVLRDRGMSLEAVAKFLGDPDREHQSFTMLLSIQDQLLEPWIEDHPAVVDGAEVLRLIGLDEPLVLGYLEQTGLIHGLGGDDDSYEVPSLAVLELAAEMITAGIAAEVSVAAWTSLQTRMAGLADELVTLFAEHPDHGFAGNDTVAEISEGFRQLRSVALRAVQVAFGLEIQRALTDYLSLAGDPEAIVPRRVDAPIDLS